MLISLEWLGRHIDLSGLSAEQIANDLTLSTAEVEDVQPFLPWNLSDEQRRAWSLAGARSDEDTS